MVVLQYKYHYSSCKQQQLWWKTGNDRGYTAHSWSHIPISKLHLSFNHPIFCCWENNYLLCIKSASNLVTTCSDKCMHICHNGCMAVLLHLFLHCRHRPTLSPSFSPSSPRTKTSTHSSTHVLPSLTFFHPAMPSHFLPPCCCLWEAWLWGWWCGGWWGDCVGGDGGYRRKRALPQQVPTCLR